MKLLAFKKLANHWYPEIPHDSLDNIRLSEKLEKLLCVLDKSRSGYIIVTLYEQDCFIEDSTLQIEDDSLCRYFTTNDDFDMKLWIGNHSFTISSTLYTILENTYDFSFHDTTYNVLIQK